MGFPTSSSPGSVNLLKQNSRKHLGLPVAYEGYDKDMPGKDIDEKYGTSMPKPGRSPSRNLHDVSYL